VVATANNHDGASSHSNATNSDSDNHDSARWSASVSRRKLGRARKLARDSGAGDSGSDEAPDSPGPESSLTLYDRHRQPLLAAPCNDADVVSVTVRTLNQELTCAVCLGIIHNTRTVMECLHRFCASCIAKSLRFGYCRCSLSLSVSLSLSLCMCVLPMLLSNCIDNDMWCAIARKNVRPVAPNANRSEIFGRISASTS
jgi:hypothetical protein